MSVKNNDHVGQEYVDSIKDTKHSEYNEANINGYVFSAVSCMM